LGRTEYYSFAPGSWRSFFAAPAPAHPKHAAAGIRGFRCLAPEAVVLLTGSGVVPQLSASGVLFDYTLVGQSSAPANVFLQNTLFEESALEVDSQCHLPRAIASVLRGLRSTQHAEGGRIVDLRCRGSEVGVIQHVRETRLKA
jgi:hypothetical protein